MSRTDLLKKLFISYKTNDNKMFYKIANEIIDEERKKNHQLIAEDLNRIINSNTIEQKYILSNTINRMPMDNERDIPLVEVIYPDKSFEDIVVTKEKKEQLKEIAEIKLPDLNCYTVEEAMKIVEGTARNMGITISE